MQCFLFLIFRSVVSTKGIVLVILALYNFVTTFAFQRLNSNSRLIGSSGIIWNGNCRVHASPGVKQKEGLKNSNFTRGSDDSQMFKAVSPARPLELYTAPLKLDSARSEALFRDITRATTTAAAAKCWDPNRRKMRAYTFKKKKKRTDQQTKVIFFCRKRVRRIPSL